MSFKAVLWALDQDLEPRLKLLLTALASHADLRDGSCFPRIRTLAREASVSVRTVHRYLPVLEQAKLIRVERTFRGEARRPHRYWLACPVEPRVGIGTRPHDSGGRTKNHYRNHNPGLARGQKPRRRSRPSTEQIAEQEAHVELARRLGEKGWEILMEFPSEVPALCHQLRAGTLKTETLAELRARYQARSITGPSRGHPASGVSHPDETPVRQPKTRVDQG